MVPKAESIGLNSQPQRCKDIGDYNTDFRETGEQKLSSSHVFFKQANRRFAPLWVYRGTGVSGNFFQRRGAQCVRRIIIKLHHVIDQQHGQDFSKEVLTNFRGSLTKNRRLPLLKLHCFLLLSTFTGNLARTF